MTDEPFPVVYSTLAPAALVSRVLPNFRVGVVQSCQLWNRGLSDVYVVETEAHNYILRVSHCHWRSRDDIFFELEFLDYLREQQIPIAFPLRTYTGDLAIELTAPEGKRYASLFIFAPGSIPVGDLNEGQGHKLGETVAMIHTASSGFRSRFSRQPLTLNYLLDQPFQHIAPFLKHREPDITYLTRLICQIKYQLRDLLQEPPYWVVCWGDPHSGNAHFTSDNDVMLFDFDQCGYGWRAFEMAKFLQISLRTGLSRKVRDAFLGSYQSIQELTDYEIASLKALTQTAHIWAWSISVRNTLLHQYSRLDDSYFSGWLEQLKRFESRDWQLF
jgi:Ser/Thr protein kinase RdoA (MazF antagonist)